jgi:hypothetical protein
VALPKISILKTSSMLIVLLIHCGLLYLLYHFQPSNQITAYKAAQLEQEQITQITFITRAKKIVLPRTESNVVTNKPLDNKLQIEFIERNTNTTKKNSISIIEPTPLDLSLPEAKLDFSAKPLDILARPRNTVEYQSTRFNDRFKPSGNAIDSLKWKSKTFNFITGILGGNQKICTDEDRKNRLPECVPDAYKPED